ATVDYGDLPDTYGTSTANNGAGHTIGTLYLGNVTPDAETDGRMPMAMTPAVSMMTMALLVTRLQSGRRVIRSI
ncbi:MAG: LruC domain-containing protein, partial [Anaerolineae bacterium]